MQLIETKCSVKFPHVSVESTCSAETTRDEHWSLKQCTDFSCSLYAVY